MMTRIARLLLATTALTVAAGATLTFAQGRSYGGYQGGNPSWIRAAQNGNAADVLGHGEAFLAVGTRNSRQAATIFAREYQGDFPSVSVARLTDGNWATLVGIIETGKADAIMRTLKAAGRIPNGSFVVPGERLDDIVWSPSGNFDHDTLELSSARTPRTPIISTLGFAGAWSARPEFCGNSQNEDLLETELQIAPRSMRWGSFGTCTFGSIVRVNGGVFLDANCKDGDQNQSFVMSLKRNGSQLVVATDPTEKSRQVYQMNACPRRGGVAGNYGQPPRNGIDANPRVARIGVEPRGNAPTPSIPVSRTPATADKPKSTGSGFFVTDNGFVVTNQHVVRECSYVQVKGFGRARVLRADATRDLAILKVEPQAKVPFIKVRTQPAQLGQDVVVFGYPLSSFLDNGLNVTTGIISSEIGMHNDKNMLQFTAAIQPGNSGGPVVDRKGNLVAVVRSKFSDKFALERGQFVPQSLNYGIKTEVLLKFLGENGVNAAIAKEGADKTVADLAASARAHTLLVTCH